MKTVFLCIIFGLFSLLFSADLTSKMVGEHTLLTLRVDSNDLISKGDKIDYRLIFEVFDDDNKTVWLEKQDLEFTSEMLENNQRLIFFFKTDLPSSEYRAYLKLNNNLRNDKKEEKFEFSVAKNQHFSDLYLIKKIGENYAELLSWDEMKTAKDIYLYQLYEEKIEELKFISESPDQRKVTDLPLTNEMLVQINYSYLIDGFIQNYVAFKLDNKLYQTKLELEEYLNSFQKKYSWDDQLSQIKYIVNDKTWKEINRNKSLSTSEKVLRFWESNNPKESQSNSLQDIFYNRILQADRKFSVHRYKQGWQTDRGRIYIKFGEPDEISVENNPIGKYPTQTWFYYRLNKTFIFYDRSRIEDYKLYNKEEEYDF